MLGHVACVWGGTVLTRSFLALMLGCALVVQPRPTLATEPGRPEPGPAPAASIDCGPNAIAEAMRDVFPPAPSTARAASADRLAFCRATGAEGVLAVALGQAGDAATALAITRALATFRSPVAITALRGVARSRFAPSIRAATMPALAEAGAGDDLVAVLGDVREDEETRVAALAALSAAGRPPDAAYLKWLRGHAGP
ncbi:MAG: hypothetical protein ABUS79_20210, partial [Pseudomonadota bacterium]